MTIIEAGGASRRHIMASIAAAAAVPLVAASRPRVGAFAFDAFVLFDPGPLASRARGLFGEQALAFLALAAAKLFGYSWLYTSAGRYRGFEALADSAFRFAAASLRLPLGDAERRGLVRAYWELETWDDVAPALERLRSAGIRLAILSNMPAAMLAANLRHGRIARDFEFVLSTDSVRQFKPAPAAYRLAATSLRLPRAAIGFAASAAWDAAGASWFGYPSLWVNRNGAPPEQLDAPDVRVSSGMAGTLRMAGR